MRDNIPVAGGRRRIRTPDPRIGQPLREPPHQAWSRAARHLVPIAFLAFRASPAAAQQASRDTSASFRGNVVLGGGSTPVAGAAIRLVEAHRSTTSGPTGEFRLSGLPPGTYTLMVRKIGFIPFDASIALRASQALEADLELVRLTATRLDTVQVRDSVHHGASRGVYERQHTIPGAIFFMRGELDSARGTAVSELLRKRARGVHIVSWAAQGAMLLASSRGMTSIAKPPRADPFDPTSPVACFSQVYVDGVRLYSPGDKAPVPDLSQYDAGSLEAVEFYPGPATTPQEYGGTAAVCGTLLLWTKS